MWSLVKLYEKIKAKMPLMQNIDIKGLKRRAVEKEWGEFHSWL